jgi:hypothetical protein
MGAGHEKVKKAWKEHGTLNPEEHAKGTRHPPALRFIRLIYSIHSID